MIATAPRAESALRYNEKGYLADFDTWDENVARTLAAEQGLELSDCHWAVIRFLREYYAFHEIPPSPEVVMRGVGHQISPHVPCKRRDLKRLFPDGGCKQACRIAGLPTHYCHSC